MLQIFFLLECTRINITELVLKGKYFQALFPREHKSFVMNYVTVRKLFCVLNIQIITHSVGFEL